MKKSRMQLFGTRNYQNRCVNIEKNVDFWGHFLSTSYVEFRENPQGSGFFFSTYFCRGKPKKKNTPLILLSFL